MGALQQLREEALRRSASFASSRFIRFTPWIGENYYYSPFGCRVLILGLSHYGSIGDDYREFTIDVLAPVACGERRGRFFTSAAGAFLNHKPTNAENAEFWCSVAFFNFAQELMPDVLDRASRELDELSVHALREVLDRLDPQFVVVCGRGLRRRLLQLGVLIPCEGFDAFRIEGEAAIVLAINHPSRAFVRANWHAKIREKLEVAGGRLL